jgi:hypothetical protein
MKYVVCVSVLSEDEDPQEIPSVHPDSVPIVAPVGSELSIQTDEVWFFGIVESVRVTHQLQAIPPVCRVDYVCSESDV